MKIPFDHKSRASPRKENRVWCLSPIGNYFSNPNFGICIHICVHIDIPKHIYIYVHTTQETSTWFWEHVLVGPKKSRNRHLLQPSILEGSCHRTRKRQHLGRWFSPCPGHMLELWGRNFCLKKSQEFPQFRGSYKMKVSLPWDLPKQRMKMSWNILVRLRMLGGKLASQYIYTFN